MKIKQFKVMVLPRKGGQRQYVYVGAFNAAHAWSQACDRYPGDSCVVLGEA